MLFSLVIIDVMLLLLALPVTHPLQVSFSVPRRRRPRIFPVHIHSPRPLPVFSESKSVHITMFIVDATEYYRHGVKASVSTH